MRRAQHVARRRDQPGQANSARHRPDAKRLPLVAAPCDGPGAGPNSNRCSFARTSSAAKHHRVAGRAAQSFMRVRSAQTMRHLSRPASARSLSLAPQQRPSRAPALKSSAVALRGAVRRCGPPARPTARTRSAAPFKRAVLCCACHAAAQIRPAARHAPHALLFGVRVRPAERPGANHRGTRAAYRYGTPLRCVPPPAHGHPHRTGISARGPQSTAPTHPHTSGAGSAAPIRAIAPTRRRPAPLHLERGTHVGCQTPQPLTHNPLR